MGTPGDKAKIRKVVKSETQTQPDVEQGSIPTTTSEIPPDPFISFSTASTSTMGVLRRTLPRFETLSSDLNIFPPISQVVSGKPENIPATSTSLEQAHIEDYFAQSKYYPENVPLIYSPSQKPQKNVPKPFLAIDQPGPSGLQTPKTKTSAGIGKVKKKSLPSQQTQKKTYTCSLCQKNFATSEKLSKHQFIHTGSSPYKCEHCKKTFTSKFKLVRHALIHSDRKPFSCTVCERTFHRKDHLKNHIKVHSPSKKVYICEKPNCKKEYTSLLSYRKHSALHAAEEGSLQCQICSSVFQTKEDIMFHLKIHAGSRTVKNPNEKKFNCEYCERKFFTKKDVRRHLVVHTGMRDFLCQFCPQRFGRKDHLVRHIKKSHMKHFMSQDNIETAIKSETITKPETITKQEIKSEFSESSISNPESFNPEIDFSLEDMDTILEQQSFDEFTPFLGPEDSSLFLPSASDQGDITTILENISEPSTSGEVILPPVLPDPSEDIGSNIVFNPDLQSLLQPSEQKNLPLPGFSQTFQPPPPAPP